MLSTSTKQVCNTPEKTHNMPATVAEERKRNREIDLHFSLLTQARRVQ